jgi:hypothetical protein
MDVRRRSCARMAFGVREDARRGKVPTGIVDDGHVDEGGDVSGDPERWRSIHAVFAKITAIQSFFEF